MPTGIHITRFSCFECNKDCGSLITMNNIINKVKEMRKESMYYCPDCYQKFELKYISNKPNVKVMRVARNGSIEDITGLQ